MKTAPKSASKLAGLIAACALTTSLVAGNGSIWPTGGVERSMAADRRASARGDIITVVVSESANATSAQTKSDTRDSALADAITQFIYTKSPLLHNGELPASSATGKSTYSGGGSVNNSQTLTARAAVLVTDVLPNGTLVIEGARRITFSGETQYVVLHGLVRPDDITSANTIASSNVADAHVEFVTEGTLTDAQKRGWLSKLYEKLRPF